jgi:lipoprotein-releasing system permease protein
MIEGIVLRYLEFDTGHLRLTLRDPAKIQLVEKRLPHIRRSDTVRAAYLELQGYGLLYANGKRSFISIRGVPQDLVRIDRGFARFLTVTDGSFDLTRRKSIVIGKALADELGIKVNDRLFVITHKTSEKKDGDIFIPRINRFTVTGIYTIGYQELDKRTVFISSKDGLTALSVNNSDTYLKMKVDDPFTDIEKKATALEREIDPQAVFWRVQAWNEINNNYYNAFQSTKILLLVIMMFIVFVAAFNIISSMIMVVLDHLQEIGILKSLGASSASITFSYVCVGFLTGLISIVSGVAAGLFVAVNINEVFQVIDGVSTALAALGTALSSPFSGPITLEQVKILNPEYYLEVIPIRIDFWEVLGVSMFALFLSIVFTFFQAWKAGRTRPLEVIRKH